MTTKAHPPSPTPGPWTLRRLDDKDRSGKGASVRKDVMFEIEPARTYPRPDRSLWKGQGGPPAFTLCRIPFNSGCEGDAEPNARLLRAAPDLLEACEAALGKQPDAMDRMAAAVRRAKGG